MDDPAVVTLISLVIALVALLIALGQLGQQLLGTADGYRRCNAEVMGDWSSTRRRRPRFRELRLEVTFEAPHFQIVNTLDIMETGIYKGASVDKSLAIDGSRESIEATMTPTNLPFGLEGTFHVGWLRLLERLQWQQKMLAMPSSPEKNIKTVERSPLVKNGLGIIRRTWSWDLLPTDVTRPLASSHLRDLLIIGYRLGMTWRGLGPSESVGADGWGHSFQSIQIRGLGLVLQYDFVDHIGQQPPEFIPTWQADILIFGMVPTDPVLFGPFRRYFDLGGSGGIVDMFTILGLGQFARRKLSPSTTDTTFWPPQGDPDLHGFCDVLYLVMPFLPLDGLVLNDYIPPLPQDLRSVCTASEGRMVLYSSLKGLLDRLESRPPQLERIFDFLSDVVRNYPERFARSEPLQRRHRTIRGVFLDRLRSEFNATTEYFMSLKCYADHDAKPVGVDGPVAYKEMLAGHIQLAVAAVEDVANKNENEYRGYSESDISGDLRNPQTVKTRMSELAHAYVDNLAHLQDKLSHPRSVWQILGRDNIRDAWWTMMLRSFIWSLSVDPVRLEGYPLPSRFYRSSTPVWIA